MATTFNVQRGNRSLLKTRCVIGSVYRDTFEGRLIRVGAVSGHCCLPEASAVRWRPESCPLSDLRRDASEIKVDCVPSSYYEDQTSSRLVHLQQHGKSFFRHLTPSRRLRCSPDNDDRPPTPPTPPLRLPGVPTAPSASQQSCSRSLSPLQHRAEHATPTASRHHRLGSRWVLLGLSPAQEDTGCAHHHVREPPCSLRACEIWRCAGSSRGEGTDIGRQLR